MMHCLCLRQLTKANQANCIFMQLARLACNAGCITKLSIGADQPLLQVALHVLITIKNQFKKPYFLNSY